MTEDVIKRNLWLMFVNIRLVKSRNETRENCNSVVLPLLCRLLGNQNLVFKSYNLFQLRYILNQVSGLDSDLNVLNVFGIINI